MAKASGSKGSRSERKAGRQRAERARSHGLPEARAERSAPGSSVGPGGDAPTEPGTPAEARGTAASRQMRSPTLVWVLGGALMILLIAYVITKFRDSGSP